MPENKAQIHVLNSMMKNPRISKMISDAWDAPVGSTKRKQVRSIINSVNKISQRRFEDGKGGPGTTSFKKTDYLPYTPKKTESYDRLIIMPSAPAMINDGKGGPANQSMATPNMSVAPKNMSVGAPAISSGTSSSWSTDTWKPKPVAQDLFGIKTREKELISGPSQIKYYYPETIEKDPTSNKLYGVPMPTGDINYTPYTPEEAAQKGAISQAAHWVGGAALPTIGKGIQEGILGTGALVTAMAKNTAAGAQNIGSALLGTNIIKPATYTNLYDTAPGRVLESMTTPHGATTTTTPSTTPTTPALIGPKTPSGYTTLNEAAKTGFMPQDAQSRANRAYVTLMQSGAKPEYALQKVKQDYGVAPAKDTIDQFSGMDFSSPARYSTISGAVSGTTGAATSPQQESANKYYTALMDTGAFSKEEAIQETKNTIGIVPTIANATTGSSSLLTGAPSAEATSNLTPSSVKDLAGESLSATAFVSDIMSRSLPELRAMFPGVPDDQLPHGASLAGQIADLQNTLKKETGLDNWLNQRQQLIDRGQTLTPDLTDYIRGRDEYIKNIDSMIDNTKNTLLNTDVSDPQVQKRLGDYMNYLYVLKGRQSKRYTDFLNSSIDQHNAQLTEVDNMYNQAKDLYTNELATKTAITQEEYNRWSTMLSDIWGAVHAQNDPNAIADLDYKRAQTNALNAKTAIDSLKALQDTKNTQYWTQQKDYKDQFVDDKGVLKDINIAAQMQAAASQGWDSRGILSLVDQGIATTLKSDSGDFNKAYSKIKDLTNGLYDIAKVANTGQSSFNPSDISQLAGGMYSVGKDIIKKYVKDNSGTFIDAIKDLTPSKNLDFEFDFMKPKGKTDWVNKYKAKGLNEDLLNDIYDMYSTTSQAMYPNDPEKSRMIFTGTDASGENPIMSINKDNIDTIADRIASGVAKMGQERIPLPAQ